VGDVYGFPFFVHRGADSSYPTRCNCSTPIGHSDACDDFDFFVGVAVFDHTVNSTSLDKPLSAYPVKFVPFLPILELLYVPPVISIEVGIFFFVPLRIFI